MKTIDVIFLIVVIAFCVYGVCLGLRAIYGIRKKSREEFEARTIAGNQFTTKCNIMKYVVTAISLLTGERTAISLPCEKDTAERLKDRQNRRNKGRGRSLYTKLRVDPWENEQWLPFSSE